MVHCPIYPKYLLRNKTYHSPFFNFFFLICNVLLLNREFFSFLVSQKLEIRLYQIISLPSAAVRHDRYANRFLFFFQSNCRHPSTTPISFKSSFLFLPLVTFPHTTVPKLLSRATSRTQVQ